MKKRFVRMKPTLLLLILLAQAITISPAHAFNDVGEDMERNSRKDRIEFGFLIGPELFEWREYAANDSELLKESGLRFGFGGYVSNLYAARNGFIYGGEARIYFGTVDYDGQVQSSDPVLDGHPFTTETDYGGIRLDGEAGWRFAVRRTFFWDVVGGVGIDSWVRDLKDNTLTVGGTTYYISGTEEDYGVFFLRLGTGPAFELGKWKGRVHFGIKQPLYVKETIPADSSHYDNDVDLSPEPRPSLYLVFSNSFAIMKSLSIDVRFFYDSYRFDQSDREVASIGGTPYWVWQPESHMDLYGLQAGMSF